MKFDETLGDISFSSRYHAVPGAEPWLIVREDVKGVAYYALFRPAPDGDVRLVARVMERRAVLPDGIPPPDPELVKLLVKYQGAQEFN